jgi:hypothetical protein
MNPNPTNSSPLRPPEVLSRSQTCQIEPVIRKWAPRPILWIALAYLLTSTTGRTQSVQEFRHVTNANQTITLFSLVNWLNVTEVNIPDTIAGLPVTAIGAGAFQALPIQHVRIPGSVTHIGRAAFARCERLLTAKISRGVTHIDDYAFASCSSLVAAPIPDSVTHLGEEAFSGCHSLTHINLPGGVAHLGTGAFAGCSSAKEITVDPLNAFFRNVDGVLFDRNHTTLLQCMAGRVGTYQIPDTISHIQAMAFTGCARLTHIAIPEGITRIEDYAFSQCEGLNTLKIPESVTHIGQNAFSGCRNLPAIRIPSGVTTIGYNAFAYLPQLASITIPRSVTFLATDVFEACRNLTTVYFEGNAPTPEPWWLSDNSTALYLPGTTGWKSTFAGRPTAAWKLPHPMILPLAPQPGLGAAAQEFGFVISWATNAAVVVEAAESPTSSHWVPISKHSLRYSSCSTNKSNGWISFTDPEATRPAARFYRLRSEPDAVEGGTNPRITIRDLLGTYRRLPVQNGFHTGTIAAKSDQPGDDRLYWLNEDRVGWDLCPRLAEGDLATSGTPYSSLPDSDRFILNIQDDQVIGFYFLGELYVREVIDPQESWE